MQTFTVLQDSFIEVKQNKNFLKNGECFIHENIMNEYENKNLWHYCSSIHTRNLQTIGNSITIKGKFDFKKDYLEIYPKKKSLFFQIFL